MVSVSSCLLSCSQKRRQYKTRLSRRLAKLELQLINLVTGNCLFGDARYTKVPVLSICLVDELEAFQRKLVYEKCLQLAGNALARNHDVQYRGILHTFLQSVSVKTPHKIVCLQSERDLCQHFIEILKMPENVIKNLPVQHKACCHF